MAKDRVVGALAIPAKVLSRDSSDGHGNPDKAIVVDADPYDVEPGQPALGSPPRSSLTAATLAEPIQRPHPRLDRLHQAEVLLLLMKIRAHVRAHQGKEGRDGKSFVTITDDLEVYRMPVKA